MTRGAGAPDGEGQAPAHGTGILQRPIGRRAFLEVAAASVVGALGAGPVTGAVERRFGDAAPAPAAEAPDAIGDLAARLEYDVDRIFRFVADEVRYEPYPGILRGAEGTLTARAGSSADQALLLAALLDASLTPVRFVMGRLDDATADALLATASMDSTAARAEADRVLRAPMTVPQPAQGLPEPEPAVLAVAERMPELSAAARDAAARQLDAGVRTIVEALADAGIALPVGGTGMPALEREQHVWVQVAAGGEWIDLDPTAPDATPGMVLAESPAEPIEALPDGMRHRVGFEVIHERLAGGSLSTEPILEHTAFVDELAGVPILLLHERPQALEGLGIGLAGAFSGATDAYQPILQVGERAFIGLSALSIGGGDDPLRGLEALGGPSDGDDPLAGLSKPEGPAASGADSTAEWLAVHLTAPSGETTTVRRTLFDRVGAARREAGDLDPADVAPADLVDLDEAHRSEFLPLRTLHVLAVAGGPSGSDLILELGSDAGTDEAGLALLERGAHLFSLSRDIMTLDLGLPRGSHVFLDGANVTAWSLALAEPGDEVQPVTARLDVLTQSFGSLPLVGARPDEPAGVLSGVLSHVAERMAMGDGLPADLAEGALPVSTGAVFDRARDQGLRTLTLRGHLPDDLPFPADALARLRRHVADGWVAIVPERPVRLGDAERLGWWLVDPRSGRTRDELDDGSAGAALDYVINVAKVALKSAGAIIRLGICLVNLYFTVTSFIFIWDVAGFVYGFIWSIPATALGCRTPGARP